MARCCGGTGTCACKVIAGRNASVTGTGSSQDPFVIANDVALAVEDSEVFDLGLSGQGTLESPWLLSVRYKDTSRLTDLPDVDAPTPGDWQVLAWSPVEDRWVAAPPATVAAGQVLTNSSMTGDGSATAPLAVKADTTRFVQTAAAGMGLTTAGINRLVRVFPDAATRDATTTAPELNTISVLNESPGRLDFWTGSEWVPITNGVSLDVQPGQMLAMSGAYDGGPVTEYIRQISTTADTNGAFDVIPAVDLLGYAGVLSARVQPIGTTPYTVMLQVGTNKITGTAYRADTGVAYAGLVVSATVVGLLY